MEGDCEPDIHTRMRNLLSRVKEDFGGELESFEAIDYKKKGALSILDFSKALSQIYEIKPIDSLRIFKLLDLESKGKMNLKIWQQAFETMKQEKQGIIDQTNDELMFSNSLSDVHLMSDGIDEEEREDHAEILKQTEDQDKPVANIKVDIDDSLELKNDQIVVQSESVEAVNTEDVEEQQEPQQETCDSVDFGLPHTPTESNIQIANNESLEQNEIKIEQVESEEKSEDQFSDLEDLASPVQQQEQIVAEEPQLPKLEHKRSFSENAFQNAIKVVKIQLQPLKKQKQPSESNEEVGLMKGDIGMATVENLSSIGAPSSKRTSQKSSESLEYSQTMSPQLLDQICKENVKENIDQVESRKTLDLQSDKEEDRKLTFLAHFEPTSLKGENLVRKTFLKTQDFSYLYFNQPRASRCREIQNEFLTKQPSREGSASRPLLSETKESVRCLLKPPQIKNPEQLSQNTRLFESRTPMNISNFQSKSNFQSPYQTSYNKELAHKVEDLRASRVKSRVMLEQTLGATVLGVSRHSTSTKGSYIQGRNTSFKSPRKEHIKNEIYKIIDKKKMPVENMFKLEPKKGTTDKAFNSIMSRLNQFKGDQAHESGKQSGKRMSKVEDQDIIGVKAYNQTWKQSLSSRGQLSSRSSKYYQ